MLCPAQARIIELQEDVVKLKQTTYPVTSWLSDFLSYVARDPR